MEQLDIHKKINERLDAFIKNNNIPHIIFHGPSGSGKRTLIHNFINKLYDNNKDIKQEYVMRVDCAHGKGIKFIREELKFFAKSNIHNKKKLFKSIILYNADNLTIDAQSALRRCIEKFSHTTRFFIIIGNKELLLTPILSRFCNIYIPLTTLNKKDANLHDYNKENIFLDEKYEKKRLSKLNKKLKEKINFKNIKNLIMFVEEIYNEGYSGIDIIQLIKMEKYIKKDKYMYLIFFENIKSEYRNEKLYMFQILYFTFMRQMLSLENIL